MSNPDKIQFVYTALKEAQDNIRTYDTKAQIVGIGFIFTLSLLFKIYEFQPIYNNSYNLAMALLFWMLILSPLVLFGAVLYPTRKVAPKVLKNKEQVKGLFYMNLFEVENVDHYVDQLQQMDMNQELSYELLKVSYLRDLKRKRFLRAMTASCISLFILLLIQVIKM